MYYVVHKGKKPGIYHTWPECKKQVDHFDGAIFKKFNDNEEEKAKKFLEEGFGLNKKPHIVTRRENDDKKNSDKIENETNDVNDDTEKIYIYTDGSCIRLKNNLSKAGYGIYIPEKNIKISEPLLNQKITNNRAELTAIIESVNHLNVFDLTKKICIFTDSQYSMYIFNGTGERYEKNNWKNEGKDVPNIDLIKKVLELKRTYNIVLLKIRAHTDKNDVHSKGNEMADKLANDGANQISKANNIFTQNTSNTQEFNEIHIDKNIQMNELFEFDELEENHEESNGELNSENKSSKKGKPLKNPKLSKWFIKG